MSPPLSNPSPLMTAMYCFPFTAYEIVLLSRAPQLLSRRWIHIQLGLEYMAGIRPAVSNCCMNDASSLSGSHWEDLRLTLWTANGLYRFGDLLLVHRLAVRTPDI